MLEEFKNKPKTEITNESVLDILNKQLEEIERDLAEAKQIEKTDTTGEDDVEQREDREEKEEVREVLQTEKELIEVKIGWIKEHGDACVAPGCPNKVTAGRRGLGGVSCPDHMGDEGMLLKNLSFQS